MDYRNSLQDFYKFFKEMEELVKYIHDDLDKIEFIENIYKYFAFKHPGVFYSPKLENELIMISNKIHSNSVVNDFEKNSYLHVLTEAWPTGGHTRLAEKFIKYFPSDTKHSAVITDLNFEIGKKVLQPFVNEKNGNIFLLDKGNKLEKARALREIASHYEYIILYHYYYDSLPILAFGVDSFKRPVIMYNHGQHLLWLGSSIIDFLLETTSSIISFTKRRRNIYNNYYVGIPLNDEYIRCIENEDKKKEEKKKLGFGNKKIILSIGGHYKYNGYQFYKYVDDILGLTPENVIFIIIGLNNTDNKWKLLEDKYKKRLFLLGYIENKDIYKYYNIADLYIDSFPTPGGTSFVDAVIRKINAISKKNGYFDIDIKKYFYTDEDNLITRTLDLLNENQFVFQKAYDELLDLLPTKWAKNTYNLIQLKCPKFHKVKVDIYFKEIELIEKFENYDFFWHEQNMKFLYADNIELFEKFIGKYKELEIIYNYYYTWEKKINILYFDKQLQEKDKQLQEKDKQLQEVWKSVEFINPKILSLFNKHKRLTLYFYGLLRLYDIIVNFDIKFVRSKIKGIIDNKKIKKLRNKPYKKKSFSEVNNLLKNELPVSSLIDSKNSICLYTWGLGPGGTERQFSYIAKGLKSKGYQVNVICDDIHCEEHRHYEYIIKEAGLNIINPTIEDALSFFDKNKKLLKNIICYIPPDIRFKVLSLAGKLYELKPQMLHCFLDPCNCIGGWAGIIAGVPHIIFSFRNHIPYRFSYMNIPWLKECYDILIHHPSIHLQANSYAGAKDYANWFNIEEEKIKVIQNGFDFSVFREVKEEQIHKFKKEIGLKENEKLIAGVFRLSEEKRPLTFIEIIHALKKYMPEIKSVITGIGPYENEMREKIKSYGLEETILLLGKRNDIEVILSSADVFLLTSSLEGFPNVIIESMYFGCPPVATSAGDIAQIIDHGKNGFVHHVDDIEGMVKSLKDILSSHEFKQNLAKSAREKVIKHYSVDNLINNIVYEYNKIVGIE